MWSEGRAPINRPLMSWRDALEQPGAEQMQHGRRLMESRPQEKRIPDDEMIVREEVASSVPGAGRYTFLATREEDGAYAMIYVPAGRAFRVRMDRIAGEKAVAWWFDPRNGTAQRIGEFPTAGERAFISPTPGEDMDWILVLDDVTRGFPAPGSTK